jgi:IS30 family transposase
LGAEVEGLSCEQRRELWSRWKEGQSLSEIGRALGKRACSVFGAVRASGGIAPAERRRREQALSFVEREEISRGLAAGLPFSRIAAGLCRAPSTVGREVARNGGRLGYRAAAADGRADDCARRPKRCRLAERRRLRTTVARKLQKQWSPQQISGWLRAEHRGDETMQVSHETIYKSLFIQARGVLKKELQAHLRSRRRMRRARAASGRGSRAGRLPTRYRLASALPR